jgi:hypothetical protein
MILLWEGCNLLASLVANDEKKFQQIWPQRLQSTADLNPALGVLQPAWTGHKQRTISGTAGHQVFDLCDWLDAASRPDRHTI